MPSMTLDEAVKRIRRGGRYTTMDEKSGMVLVVAWCKPCKRAHAITQYEKKIAERKRERIARVKP